MDDKIEQQREFFNKIAQVYYDSRRHTNHILLKTLMWREVFKDWQGPKTGNLRVLEAMCGFAEGKQIIEDGLGVEVQYSGLDYSDEVVAKVKKMRPDLNVVCEDVTQFEPTQIYDIVILLGGLHHVPDAAPDVVERLATALREGGYFISFEPTHDNTLFRLVREFTYRRNSLFDDSTERAFVLKDLIAMYENAGFSPLKIMYPGLLSYVLYYNPDAFPFLNWGGERTVRTVFSIDRLFFQTFLGRKCSFATLSVWRKEDEVKN